MGKKETLESPNKPSNEEIKENWRRFFEWRDNEIERIKDSKKLEGTCGCIESILNSSWASDVHNIKFHVCEKHAKEFDIPLGPHWENPLEEK